MKKIAVFDIDGTIYRGTLTIAIVEELVATHGTRDEQESLEAARHVWKERDSAECFWEYNRVALKEFEVIIQRISREQLRSAAYAIVSREEKYRYVFTTDLVRKLKSEGYILIAMSGSIKDVVEPFVSHLGFDIVIASELEVVDGVFTGRRVRDTHKGKDTILKALVEERGLSMEDSIGVGDTHRDISLLSVVDHAIAFNPNAAFYVEAAKRGWDIVLERKNMIYELKQRDGVYVVVNAHANYEGGEGEIAR